MFVGVVSYFHLTFGRPLRVWFELHPQMRFDLFVMLALNLAAETRMPHVKSFGWFPIFSELQVALILPIPTFRVWFEVHPQIRFDLFVILALNLAAETRMSHVKSFGWFSVFPELRIARILSIPMASMDGSLSFLVSLAPGVAQKRLASVWSCMLQNLSLLKSLK
jgi:hypothetical protein